MRLAEVPRLFRINVRNRRGLVGNIFYRLLPLLWFFYIGE